MIKYSMKDGISEGFTKGEILEVVGLRSRKNNGYIIFQGYDKDDSNLITGVLLDDDKKVIKGIDKLPIMVIVPIDKVITGL